MCINLKYTCCLVLPAPVVLLDGACCFGPDEHCCSPEPASRLFTCSPLLYGAYKRGSPRAGGRKCVLRRSWTELGLNGNARRPLLLAEVARTSVLAAWAMSPVLQCGREPKGKVIESQLACTPALAYPLFFTFHLVFRRGGSFVRQSTFASPSCSQA